MKKFYLLHCVAIIILLAVTGCASAGRNFNYSLTRNQLLIGKTTRDEALQIMGEPSGKTSKTADDGQFDSLTYTYAYATGGGSTVDIRALALKFRNGVLTGKDYISSFSDDTTDFDPERKSQIKRGISTKRDVELILGSPTGTELCPSYDGIYEKKCKLGVEIWSWQYMRTISRMRRYKNLFITFNDDGVVSDVELQTNM